MKRKFLFYCLIGLCCFSWACSRPKASNELGLDIRLSEDSTALVVDHLPQELLHELASLSAEDESWKGFFAVYEDAENPEVQHLLAPLSGSYEIEGRAVAFRPALPFIRGKGYIVQVYAQNLQMDALSLFKPNGWQMKQSPLEYKFRY